MHLDLLPVNLEPSERKLAPTILWLRMLSKLALAYWLFIMGFYIDRERMQSLWASSPW